MDSLVQHLSRWAKHSPDEKIEKKKNPKQTKIIVIENVTDRIYQKGGKRMKIPKVYRNTPVATV